MKLYKGSKKIGILLTMLLALSIFSTELFAIQITRECKAHYYAMVTSFSYENEKGDKKFVSIPYGEMRVDLKRSLTYAGGSCGELVPNRCRKRARDKLIECGWFHAKFPNDVVNAACSRIRSGYEAWTDPVTPLDVAKQNVCKRPLDYSTGNNKMRGVDVTTLFPENYTVNFIMGVHTYGKKGCGSKNPDTFTTLDGERFGRKKGSSSGHLFTPLKSFTVTCP